MTIGNQEIENPLQGECRYSFLVDWFDHNAQLLRRYTLVFFPESNSVEMLDLKNHRTFLKKVKYDNLKASELSIGGMVNVFSRQLKIIDYGDEFTRRALTPTRQTSLMIIRGNGLHQFLGSIFDLINEKGFSLISLKMGKISDPNVLNVFSNQNFDISANLILAVQISKQNSVLDSHELAKLINSKANESICHVSSSLESASRELNLVFGNSARSIQTSSSGVNSTLCVIKPHTVLSGHSGKIISSILQNGFKICAMQMFHLPKANAEEFLEVYKGVIPEYHAAVDEFTAGKLIALEIQQSSAASSDKIVEQFRSFVGPSDPEIARHLRPNTLRARFGIDKVQNSVHCTDLPEDGPLEVEYFFKLLQ